VPLLALLALLLLLPSPLRLPARLAPEDAHAGEALRP
jgi:hypothetical protein